MTAKHICMSYVCDFCLVLRNIYEAFQNNIFYWFSVLQVGMYTDCNGFIIPQREYFRVDVHYATAYLPGSFFAKMSPIIFSCYLLRIAHLYFQ